MNKFIKAVVLTVCIAGFTMEATQSIVTSGKRAIVSELLPKAIAPYTPAILHTTNALDQTLYVSGILPMLKNGDLVQDPKEATVLVMDYIKALLLEAGMDWTNVIDVVLLVRDINEFGVISATYGEYLRVEFEGKDALLPVRLCFQPAVLPKNAVIEMKVIAINNL